VAIKEGSATSFWNDVWHMDEALADRRQYTVTARARMTWSGWFCCAQAAQELQEVRSIVAQTILSQLHKVMTHGI